MLSTNVDRRFAQNSVLAGANVICLTYTSDWWAVIGPVMQGESKSQATRSSSDHMGLLHTLSTIDTPESKLRVRLVLEVLAQLMVGENSSWEFPKIGVHLVLEVRLILETGGYVNLTTQARQNTAFRSGPAAIQRRTGPDWTQCQVSTQLETAFTMARHSTRRHPTVQDWHSQWMQQGTVFAGTGTLNSKLFRTQH